MEYLKITYYEKESCSRIVFFIRKSEIKSIKWHVGELKLKISWENESLEGYTQTNFSTDSLFQDEEIFLWEAVKDALEDEVLEKNPECIFV